MTPARVIINAVGVGSLAWLGIFILRLLPGVIEPFLVEQLQAFLVQVQPGCSLQPWHASSEGWYGHILEAIHPAIVIGTVSVHALRDVWKLLKGE